MYDDICAALDQAAKDPSVRVAVTTGTGDYYCSGTDLSNFTDIPPDGPEKMAEEGMIILRWVGDAYALLPVCLEAFFVLLLNNIYCYCPTIALSCMCFTQGSSAVYTVAMSLYDINEKHPYKIQVFYV